MATSKPYDYVKKSLKTKKAVCVPISIAKGITPHARTTCRVEWVANFTKKSPKLKLKLTK